MAYSKIPVPCTDYALGYQDVNQAIDNSDALKTLYAADHGTEEPLPGDDPYPWASAGKHDIVQVAKTVARVEAVNDGGSVRPRVEVHGWGILRIERVGTGQWEIDLIGGVGQWVSKVQIEGTGSTVRTACAYHPLPNGTTLYVTTYELASGHFGAADFNFSVVVWGSGR